MLTVTTQAGSQTVTNYLVLPDTVVETNGAGAPFELGLLAGRPVLTALRITEVVEQESLHVSIWGSADGQNWGGKPLFWFPQKFYQGVTPAALDLNKRPEIKYLRARWEVNRWGRCDPRPYFRISVELQELTPE